MDFDIESFKKDWERRDAEEKVAWEKNELPPNPSTRQTFKYNLRNDKILVNFNGHFGQPEGPIALSNSTMDYEHSWSWIYDKLLYPMSVFFYDSLPDEEKQVELPTFIRTETCGECGEKVDIWWTGEIFEFKPHTNVTAYVNETPSCAESGGIKDYAVEIDVPSGKLVFANDFRAFVPEADKDRYVNYSSEIKKTVIDYAESNMLHAFVGNSCPGVYVKNDIIIVGNPGYDDEDNPVFDLGRECGSICTDLWWFSATDYEYLKKRGVEQEISDKEIESWIEVSLSVDPGRYRMTVHTNPAPDGEGWRSGERFATITKMQ
jgi:hypothetical protein